MLCSIFCMLSLCQSRVKLVVIGMQSTLYAVWMLRYTTGKIIINLLLLKARLNVFLQNGQSGFDLLSDSCWGKAVKPNECN